MISRVFFSILLICLAVTQVGWAAGTNLPADWPADATPPPDAKILSTNIAEWTQTITFELPAPEAEALADVAERLAHRGWSTDSIDRTGKAQRLECSNRDGRRVTVLAHGTLAGSTAMLLTIYQPKRAY